MFARRGTTGSRDSSRGSSIASTSVCCGSFPCCIAVAGTGVRRSAVAGFACGTAGAISDSSA